MFYSDINNISLMQKNKKNVALAWFYHMYKTKLIRKIMMAAVKQCKLICCKLSTNY
ncbi:hypothetical protein S2091_1914 [Solimicrobium silvestre]|uniref:Uncharacterized protein n=1 Tax=Solimicrobium silvestre TaxID=2099400 RepID=A0A2S9H0N2_9BURK|nr:hypothetical protein S2091_1914 [Solimicrobium silvestre]